MSGRGLAAKTINLIDAAYEILEEIQPATVRAVCYKLFTRGLIAKMSKGEGQKVSKALVYARENDVIPWEWIVDETRRIERVATWTDLAEYGECVVNGFRKDLFINLNASRFGPRREPCAGPSDRC